MKKLAIPIIIVLMFMIGLGMSYAQFDQGLFIGTPEEPNIVSTGELDAGISIWTGLGGTYAKVTPLLGIYDPPVHSVEFEISNAYPGYGSSTLYQPDRMLAYAVIKNTGSIPVKVESIVWDLPDYVTVRYWGGNYPPELVPDFLDAINQAEIPQEVKNEISGIINENGNGMHEGLILYPPPTKPNKDAFIFQFIFGDETPEDTTFTGKATMVFTQVNAP